MCSCDKTVWSHFNNNISPLYLRKIWYQTWRYGMEVQQEHLWEIVLPMLISATFFHPRHNGQWPPNSKGFYTRSYPLHYFLILILEKKPVFPFPMLSAKLRDNGQWHSTSRDFYPRFDPLHFCPIFILQKEPGFPFQCWVLNRGTTGTIFITSFGMTRSLNGDWTRDLPHSKPHSTYYFAFIDSLIHIHNHTED